MNVAVRLTLDGMIRALRWQAHRMADEVEHRYGGERVDPGPSDGRSARGSAGRGEGDDDRFGK